MTRTSQRPGRPAIASRLATWLPLLAFTPSALHAQQAPSSEARWAISPEFGAVWAQRSRALNLDQQHDGRVPGWAAGLGVGYRVWPRVWLTARGSVNGVDGTRRAFSRLTPSTELASFDYQFYTLGGGVQVDLLHSARASVSAGLEVGRAQSRYRDPGGAAASAVCNAFDPLAVCVPRLSWDEAYGYLAPSLSVAVPLTRALAVNMTGRTLGRAGPGWDHPGLTLGLLIKR